MSVYPFIEAERAQQRTVKRACELLEVTRAAYYAHRAGTVSARQRTDAELTEYIHQAHKASKGRYGAPRIHAELRRRGHRHGQEAGRPPDACRRSAWPHPTPVEAHHDPRPGSRRPGRPDPS